MSQVAISSFDSTLQKPSVHITIMSPSWSSVRLPRSITGSTSPPRQLKIRLRSGCVGDLVRGDDALVDEVLDLRMVLRLGDQFPPPEEVEARIADVRPVRVAGLDHAGDARRARRLQHRELVRVRAERLMGAGHRVLQELERILEDRLRLPLEALDEQPHADLRRDLAAGVPAHAVGDDSSSVSRPYV